MHRTEFSELNAFVAVAERRNFARAAQHLGIVPSTISQTIRTLEERLGVRLLNRTTRSVSLTDAGEQLLARIRPALMELHTAVDDLSHVRNVPSGTLRLSVSNVAAQIVLAPMIKDFLATYPAIALDIAADDNPADIVNGRFDAGIRVGRFIAKDMQAVRLSEPSRTIVVAAPSYLQQSVPLKTPEDLPAHNCIRLRSSGHLHPWQFVRGKKKLNLQVNGSLVMNSMHLVLRAALEGIGVAYVLESCVAAEIASGRLVPLLSDWSAEYHSYYLYYAGRRQLPVPLAAFIAFVRQDRKARRLA
ncbi:DNA-binding transcriptional regulator, LysR family [Enhydrobacter aerosaccus]|uniref:DNA-binding transcriptional regulator, LysR family n=1 Tax=Enhydrobacter aerosaccus TaxID=225324 RepID=A0A1T4K6D5_9HYPH|nr:LysR substrate-binding domain-containing protein [Enhydrobacter aerosaccus]SJZ37994.1 DNA-binding transcriptional regulator, LysR family [Enhydrobacter aerosaccus]